MRDTTFCLSVSAKPPKPLPSVMLNRRAYMCKAIRLIRTHMMSVVRMESAGLGLVGLVGCGRITKVIRAGRVN